ncbi:unnamed protein product [Cyprideis torosa]|uniref:Uncharacterized protein n=1 Tax=Cyprideis torosa TaxID=163714 RepID=A0A7R8W3V4_9CRUS|nr:unnamed protein product [Cyprideis torosa]CAG0883448.1 unnamed protein product [Cyprideis torosa]
MVDAAASLLDELMGRFRNEDPEKMNKKLKWNDEDVCQFYCLRFCPNDLFTNTRADLGPCRKIHDEDAKESFKSAAAYEKRQLEDEFIRYAGNLLRDVDRKIAKGKERLALALQTEAMNLPPNLQRESKEKVALLTEKINKLISEAEEMGSEGKRQN